MEEDFMPVETEETEVEPEETFKKKLPILGIGALIGVGFCILRKYGKKLIDLGKQGKIKREIEHLKNEGYTVSEKNIDENSKDESVD